MFPQSSIEKIKSKKIYALEGNIGAGKTTILKILSKQFKDVEFVEEPVKEWQNLGGMNLLDSFYSDPQRWGFSFEFYSMLTKIQALLKAADSDKPIIIIERSILSNKVFMDLSKELGKLEKMEYCMLINTYNFYLENVYPQISGIIYLDTPVDECMKRITKRNRGEECGIERSYLEALKTKLDELANSSTMVVIRIDGIYDCSRDAARISDNVSLYLHPNQSPKAAIPCGEN
jgi:deoxyadenosine/deoxycytidine kinase